LGKRQHRRLVTSRSSACIRPRVRWAGTFAGGGRHL